MRDNSHLHQVIGKLVVQWASIENTLDSGIILLGQFERFGSPRTEATSPSDQFSASRQFERVRKQWKERFAAIDLSGGLYACDTGRTASELKRHRHLRDLLVHGGPSRDPFTEDDLVGLRMSTAAKSAFFQASVRYKHKELASRGMNPRTLKFGLREFMASTGELLIPLSEIIKSSEHLPGLHSQVTDAHLDLNRLISDKLNKRFGEGSRG